MNKEIVSTPAAPAAIGPYSQAVKTGLVVFLSGQVGLDPTTKELQAASSRHRCARRFATCRGGEGLRRFAGACRQAHAVPDRPVEVRQGQRDHGRTRPAAVSARARPSASPACPRARSSRSKRCSCFESSPRLAPAPLRRPPAATWPRAWRARAAPRLGLRPASATALRGRNGDLRSPNSRRADAQVKAVVIACRGRVPRTPPAACDCARRGRRHTDAALPPLLPVTHEPACARPAHPRLRRRPRRACSASRWSIRASRSCTR